MSDIKYSCYILIGKWKERKQMHAYYIHTLHTHHDATLATQLIDHVMCEAIGHLSSNNCTALRNTKTRQ